MTKKSTFRQYIVMTIGICLIAISAEFFLIPNEIAAGGITGLCVVLNSFIPTVSVEVFSLIINVFLIVGGFKIIGGDFGLKTIYASLGLSGLMWVIQNTVHPGPITGDLMLTAIIAPCLTGTGLALVFSQNASSGGTDIIAKILNKYAKIDIGKCMLIIDAIVTILGAVRFGLDKAMYAIIIIALNGTLIDKVINGFSNCKQIMILSNKSDTISKYIMKDLDRGCTVIAGKGAYSGISTDILYCVLSRKQFMALKSYIKEIDSKAFITVTETHEVFGQGFGSMSV